MIFDRRVTLALLFAIFLETAGGFIWAGQTSQRLSQLEGATAQQGVILERIARLEAQVGDARASLVRIERSLEQTRSRR